MSILNAKHFHNEKAAFAFVEARVWPEGPVCPHCGNYGKIYDLKGVRSKPSKKNPKGKEYVGLKKCAECRKPFTVRVGTIFEDSHIPLHLWLQAIFLMVSSKKGISSNQLHRTLGVTLKTAWFMSHRIREAMKSTDRGPLGGAGEVVEVDETYFGRPDGTPKSFKWSSNKNAVLALVERGGKARTYHLSSSTIANIYPHALGNISPATFVMTDESPLYKRFKKQFRQHETVRHADKEYVRGMVHTNTVEGYFSIFKRGMKGVYQHCSEKHLHRYLAEFDFRYNNRKALGVDDAARADIALKQIKGKRLTYRTTNN
jgi:transposase-like protein